MPRPTKYLEHRLLVLAQIRDAELTHARSPAVRVLADSVSVGVATMHYYLTRLADEGLIDWRPKAHRTLRCTPLGVQLLMP